MGINTCASLKIDLCKLEFCVRLKLRFGNLNIFNYRRDKFLTDEFLHVKASENYLRSKIKITSFTYKRNAFG